MVYIMKGLEDDICVSDNEPVNVSLSILVTFGLLISYLPQVFRIIRYKSSEGISPWFLLFGTVSATCSLFNILILQFHMIKCCRVVPGITCLENTLGIIQLAIQWFMFMLIFALFMSYFPSHRKLAPYIRHLHFNTPPTKWSIEWRNSVGVAVVVLIHFIVVATITVLLLLFYGHHDVNWMKMWADFLGVVSMMLVSIQFIPQLYRTCSRKSVGALSIPMMFIQVPLSFIFVYTLATRPGTRWTTWIVFFVSGCLQGILLLMCICWYFRSRRLGHGPFYVGETDQLLGRDGRPLLPDERTTLISKIQRRRSPRPSTSRGSSYSYNSSSAGSVAGTPTRDLTVNNNNNNNYLAVSS